MESIAYAFIGAAGGVGLAALMTKVYPARFRSRKVVVHTRAGTSIAGLLVGTYPGHVALRSAALVGPDSDTPLAGEVVIERSSIDFIQLT